MSLLKAALLFSTTIMFGCSGDYKMVEYQRDEKFFSSFHNSSAEIGQAASKIETVKLLQTNDDYPIRLVIYDNGKFYYQVDELGTGIGDWKFEDGGLTLTTRRKIFDLNFYLTAAAEAGDEVVVKFIDRHGFNQHKLEYRNPTATDPNGTKPGKLREFRSSIKDI